jgi:tRNA-dihydrouridine synthase
MRLYLAPLHGVTNRIFRTAWFRHFGGFDGILAPFILAVGANGPQGKHFKDLVPESGRAADPGANAVAVDSGLPGESPAGIPLVPQILGNDARSFLATAWILADLGYTEINWNLGCPYPMVARKGRGSGLLPHPDRVQAFLDEVSPRLSAQGIALSVKLRLGREYPDEILALMPILNAHPLSRLIIHPRVGTQMYRGAVNLDAFARALELSGHRVVYNGDIRDRSGFEKLRARFPQIQDWMIGRGSVADPFLPARLKGLAVPADPLAEIRAFHDDLYGLYRDALSGPGHLLDKMKEVWTYLGASFAGTAGPSAGNALATIARAKSVADYDRAVRIVFSEGKWKGAR